MMSGIRGKDTRPELTIRRALHRRGFRYVLHSRKIPGRPDLVFPSRHAVIFIHGCFWHGHDCRFFRLPSTRTEFWQEKIEANRNRDHEVHAVLERNGWRQLTIWECALRGKTVETVEHIVTETAAWLDSASRTAEIRGD
jgi:DNA mismatch endonuclease (patch repair protein)